MSIADIQVIEDLLTDRVLQSFLQAMVPSLETFNGAIAAEDEMFLSALENAKGDRVQAAIRYYSNGIRIFQAVQQIITHHFGSEQNLSTFLDFAAGYGRFTRFLTQILPPENIWISDIYPQAIQFQAQQFHVHTLPSTFTPTDYHPHQTFDCILASSFFSHTPENTFIPWLQTLYHALADGGLLIISVHDVTLAPNPFALSESGIHFIPQSESRTLDPSIYGTTYVSEEFIQHSLNQILGTNATYHRLPKGLAEHQDLYLIPKHTTPDWSTLHFQHHPQGTLENTYLNSSGDWEFKGRVWSVDPQTPLKAIELWTVSATDVGNCGKLIHRSLPRLGIDQECSWVCYLNRSQATLDDVVIIKAISAGNRALERILICQTLAKIIHPHAAPHSQKATGDGTLILVGMHRSGTSLTASLLHSAGVNMGERLVGARVGNERGHFEDLDFVEFHQKVLRSQGLELDGLTERFDLAVAPRYEEVAQALIRQKKRGTLWGWKDPRTTLFLPFWAQLLPEAYFICVYRAPWEVVDSLYRRGSDEVAIAYPQKAVELWVNYNRQILAFVKANPERCFLAHLDRIISHPQSWIAEIEALWDLPLGVLQHEMIESELLVRNSSESYYPALIKVFFPEAISLYEELQSLAGSWKSSRLIDFERGLERIKNYTAQDWAFRNWQEVRSASEYQRQVKRSQKRLEQQERELRKLRSQYEESEYQKFLIKQELKATQNQWQQGEAKSQEYFTWSENTIHRLRSQLEQANYQLQQKEQTLQQIQADAVQLNENLVKTTSELQHTHSLSAEIQNQLNHQVQDLHQQLHRATLELAAMKANRFWRWRIKWVKLKKTLGLIKE